MTYTFQNKDYQVKRYPKTDLSSLKAWNASDELILEYLTEKNLLSSPATIYHDRFGFLSTLLSDYKPTSIILFQSQKKSIVQNLKDNSVEDSSVKYNFPLDALNDKTALALVKIPKSADLFELYLQQLISHLKEDALVIAGFMTKYFNKQSLEIAQKYFEVVEQSKAKKKARLFILKRPKTLAKQDLTKEINLSDKISFKQYYGVFSAKRIDFATQFFMEHFSVLPSDNKILDLGTGNGVIAWKARKLSSTAKINLLDDNYLAVESAKLNMPEGENFYHFNDDLLHITNNSYDLVLSNPPFHFEHETNI